MDEKADPPREAEQVQTDNGIKEEGLSLPEGLSNREDSSVRSQSKDTYSETGESNGQTRVTTPRSPEEQNNLRVKENGQDGEKTMDGNVSPRTASVTSAGSSASQGDKELPKQASHPPHTPDFRTLARTFDGSSISPEEELSQNDTSETSRPRTDSEATTKTNGTQRSSSVSSMIFIVNALEAILASKEARKKKQLGDSAQKALTTIRESDPQLPDAEVIFEPLQLAILTNNVGLATTALDCIGKLISYSYLSMPRTTQLKPLKKTPDTLPLIERAIDTIIDCFQGESTPVEIQLQILKSLLTAVLNDKIIVHGAGLLKAVRQTYNIFLLSKSSANQQVAQGTLTQMVGTVFERLKTRLAMKEARLNMSKLSVERSTSSRSPSSSNAPKSANEIDETISDLDAAEMSSSSGQESAQRKEPRERITLQSFENRKSFDDERIQDNAPTLVTRASANQLGLQKLPHDKTTGSRENSRKASGNSMEDVEDEIYIKDAFLVFRAMCKLSIKTLPPDQLLDLKSHGMRSKLLSLHLVHMILNNHMAIFLSPLATIRGSGSDEPSTFLNATKQYLCLCLSRNGASSVTRVFEVGCEIFWLMLKNMRVMLKKEIEVFLKEIYLAILDRRNAPAIQKQRILSIFERLCTDPRALVEIYLNYDCDRTALDNMFQRIIEHLSKLSSTNVPVTPLQQQQYDEQYQRRTHSSSDWQDPGTIPPSLSTANIINFSELESPFPAEYSLKRQSLDCLVATLRSLVDWSQQGIADASGLQQEQDSRLSADDSRESLEIANHARGTKYQSTDSPRGSVTPVIPLEDDPDQLEVAKQQKTALFTGIKQFNFKPKRGVKYLLKEGFIRSDRPEDVAEFLHQTPGLNKAMIGEYLGEGDAENVAIMHAFVDSMDFTRTRFVDALRRFLQSFRLPGEAQKIDRFMLKFAERYMTGNPNAFANADTAYVLAYSVIMLNTDQHSSKIKGRRMTREDFIKNNRGINDNADLPDEYLSSIYDEITHNEIVLDDEQDAATALGMTASANAGFAANIGQALATVGRDLQREAYVQASQEMATKTELLFRSLVRAQRRSTSRSELSRFIPAMSFKHVGPMFEVSWMSFLSGLAGHVQDTQNLETIKLCMEGFKHAIRICCLFDLETPRVAFLSALAKFTNLNNLSEMVAKNMEALKILLEVAQSEGNLLKESWKEILTCISQLDRFQLISSGVDEGAVPDVSKARIVQPIKGDSAAGRKPTQPARRPNLKPGPSTSYLLAVAEESRSTDIIKAVDRIFTNTAYLSGEAIVHFVRALSEVSWQEIQSSGQSESPRTFSLQKLVEISYYNMTRVRFEWTAVWQVLGEHFNQVGCHSNTNVVFMALDSLRQLSMRFMEIEELPGFNFQKDFLKPFEHVIANTGVVTVKDMILRCLIQMIQARGHNIRSGWRTMFGVFTVAAREPYEGIVNLAFDHVNQIYNNRFGMVVSQGAFPDLVVCLTEFSKNMKFQKKSLQAIEMLKSTIPKMLRTPECPLSNSSVTKTRGPKPVDGASPRSQEQAMQEEQFWFPVLFAFHNVLMTGDDLEVRSRALSFLFETLIKYGGDFSSEFWDILWRQLLYPIFMVLKSKSELTKALNHEELSVWLSTTMIQALRNMITLFTHYFDSLEYMLDRFLDLLTLCICQENDTIARIGSNCLQQLILQNVHKFEDRHWTKIVGAFVELFERTTAYQLFSAATTSGSTPVIANGELTPGLPQRSNSLNEQPLLSPGLEGESSGPGEENSLKINGLPPAGQASVVTDTAQTPTTPGVSSSKGNPSDTSSTELEDYRPTSELQQQPIVVTAARRRFFNKIITRCVLQLLMIETVNELFSNDAVYTQIPSPELLRLMGLLKKSFLFARRFNADKDLRMRLWREGFMKQPPNLLKQESGSAATYVSILLRMYHDDGEERKRSRDDTEAALIPLCVDIIRGYVMLDEESQHRNMLAWRPVVVDVLDGYTNFPREGFEKHVETFYPLAVDLLGRELGAEVRIALQALLRRVGEVRIGMAMALSSGATPGPRGVADPSSAPPPMSPTSPTPAVGAWRGRA